jgi:hypothetical protein
MFCDSEWLGNDEQGAHYHHWEDSVLQTLKENKHAKIVLVEIGCGIRVPSVRYQSESWLEMATNATLVRINPDFPLSGESWKFKTIPIMNGGLASIKKIDEFLTQMESKKESDA